MNILRSTFRFGEGIYGRLFADWLHINFVVRTVLLLLMVWLIIYVAALAFKHAIGPFLMHVYVNVLKRGWNFLVIETVQEWLYIRYYSKGSQRFLGLYLRLTDRARHNRKVLESGEHKGEPGRKRVRRLANQMMISAGIIAAMWIVAFGINLEYTAPAWAAAAEEGSPDTDYSPEPGEGEGDEPVATPAPATPAPYDSSLIRPYRLSAQASLALTQEAQQGARLRSGPGTAGTTVIEWLWGDDPLTYLGYYVPDPDVETLYWIRVLSASGVTGYIGSHLVEVIGG